MPIMPAIREILRDPFALIIPLVLLAGTILLGLLVRRLFFRVVKGWAARTQSHLDVLIIESLRGPIVLWILILGLHVATQSSEIPRRYLQYVPTVLAVLWILSLTMAMSHLAGSAVRFYGGRVTGVQAVTSLTQKLAQVAVVILGAVWLLRVVFNMSLTPLLTTLGVGGLAVALALQDTLSNLFAGFYVSISGLVHIGDYIKLNTGEEGYVADINWRCTTMLNNNNLVIVPNNKLGQAIYTNYHLPAQKMGTSVSFSVGYDCDIDRVQEIALKEVEAAVGSVEGLVGEPAPSILFSPPTDSGLVFQLNFSVTEFGKQGGVQSALRKRVYRRLKAEGFEMPLPARTVLVEQKAPARLDVEKSTHSS
jgi:small-conductance mechanosensitive channel